MTKIFNYYQVTSGSNIPNPKFLKFQFHHDPAWWFVVCSMLIWTIKEKSTSSKTHSKDLLNWRHRPLLPRLTLGNLFNQTGTFSGTNWMLATLPIWFNIFQPTVICDSWVWCSPYLFIRARRKANAWRVILNEIVKGDKEKHRKLQWGILILSGRI